MAQESLIEFISSLKLRRLIFNDWDDDTVLLHLKLRKLPMTLESLVAHSKKIKLEAGSAPDYSESISLPHLTQLSTRKP